MNLKEYKGQRIIWINLIALCVIHCSGVWCLATRLTKLMWITYLYGLMNLVLMSMGVTAGAHRLWSHRSYKAKLPYNIFLLIFFTMSAQMSVFDWVRTHRTHHRFSDTDADPHNSKRGFFFSHIGWYVLSRHQEVLKKRKVIDMSDIENDPLLAFHRRHYNLLRIIFAYIIPVSVPPLLWGESWFNSLLYASLILTVNIHMGGSVNSFAHLWGSKPYLGKLRSVDNKLVSIVSWGEGWHNYHHTFPWDYKARELGPDSLELTTKLIELAAWLGLCYDLKEPSQELIRRVALRHGDGSWQQSSCPPSADSQNEYDKYKIK